MNRRQKLKYWMLVERRKEQAAYRKRLTQRVHRMKMQMTQRLSLGRRIQLFKETYDLL